MKKEQLELKELIKAAILEAFAEMYGVATTDGQDLIQPQPEGDSEGSDQGSNTGNDSGNNPNNGLSDENSGGTPGKGNKPKPDAGVGVFGLK